MTDPEKIARALSGEYVGDAASLGRVLAGEIERLRGEVEWLTGMLDDTRARNGEIGGELAGIRVSMALFANAVGVKEFPTDRDLLKAIADRYGEIIEQIRAENAALWSLIVQPWTRDGDGAEMFKVNLAWWDSAVSQDDAVGMVRELIERQKTRKGDDR